MTPKQPNSVSRRGLVAAGIGVAALEMTPSGQVAAEAHALVVERDRVGPRAPRRPAPNTNTVFVATNGSDTGDGSNTHPFASLQRAYAAASPGTVIMLRAGSYSITDYVTLKKKATKDNPITLMSYPGEWAILNFAVAKQNPCVRLDGAEWHVVRDLEIRNSPAQGVLLIGKDTRHNTFVNVVARDSNGSGFQIYQGSYNRFFDCLAVFTRSPDVPGDADGFGSIGRGGPSRGNRFYRCVAVDAPDDGFDAWEGDHTTFVACWAIRAGRFGGNGNGFKLGPGPGASNSIWAKVPPRAKRNRTFGSARFNLAIDCAETGFDGNGGMDTELVHNTSFGNKTDFASYPVSRATRGTNTLINNLGEGNVVATGSIREQRNSWNLGFDTSAQDFESVVAPATQEFHGLTGRQAYQMLMSGPYARLFRLRAGSSAIDAGAQVDISHHGLRPDLGAFEA
jgi:hypothetical protein